MEMLQFHRMRTAIQVNASPGKAEDLETVEGNLRELLMTSGLFEEVEVDHTDDPDQLVIALCRFRPFYTERDIADRLERMWSDRVRYPFWEAHSMTTADGFVEFEAATRESQHGGYVTVHLVAQQGSIPEQRPATA